MKRLNGVDALMLYTETPEVHMHTLKIGVLDVSNVEGGFSFDLFRAVAFPRLQAMAPLRYQLVDIPLKLHHPMWVVNDDIDFDYHVRPTRVPAPGGRRELDQLIGEIASTPLDRSRPLWEMYVAEGLADNRIAIIHKVHHVLADGVASANQMAKAMAPSQPSEVMGMLEEPDLARTRTALLKAAGRDHVGLIRKLPRLVNETATGVSRVRRRSKERGEHPDLARNFAPPRLLHQPCGHHRAPVRDGAARAGGCQGDRQAPRRHDQRHGAGDVGRGAAPAAAAVRRSS